MEKHVPVDTLSISPKHYLRKEVLPSFTGELEICWDRVPALALVELITDPPYTAGLSQLFEHPRCLPAVVDTDGIARLLPADESCRSSEGFH